MFNWLFSNTPLGFLVQSLWRDEGFSVLLAKKNLFEIIINSAKDFTPPIYHFVLHFWIKLFGQSEIAVRSLSIIFYWCTVYVGFLFLSNVFKFSLKKSFLYTLLLAINPVLVYYAYEARMYTMFAFFSVLSFYSFYLKRPKLYLITSILGLYTHYFMIVVILSQYFISKSKKQLYILLTVLPWLVFTLFYRNPLFEPFWISKPDASIFTTLITQIYTGYEQGLGFYDKSLPYFSIALWFFVIYGLIKLKTNKPAFKIYKFLFVWALAVPIFIALISFVKPVFLPRYLIFSSVGLVLLIVFTIDKLPTYLKTVIVILIFAVTFSYNFSQINQRTKSNLKKPLKEIKAQMKKDDLLFVTSELDYFVAQYYLGEDNVYIWGKTFEEIPNFVGKSLIEPGKIALTLPTYPKKAFVLSSDGSYTVMALY